MCRSLRRPCIETIHSQRAKGDLACSRPTYHQPILLKITFFLKFRFFRQKQGDFVIKDFPNFDFFKSKIGFERFLTSCLAILDFRAWLQHSSSKLVSSLKLALIRGPRFETNPKSTKVIF